MTKLVSDDQSSLRLGLDWDWDGIGMGLGLGLGWDWRGESARGVVKNEGHQVAAPFGRKGRCLIVLLNVKTSLRRQF